MPDQTAEMFQVFINLKLGQIQFRRSRPGFGLYAFRFFHELFFDKYNTLLVYARKLTILQETIFSRKRNKALLIISTSQNNSGQNDLELFCN